MAAYNHKALSRQWIVNVGHSFVEDAKEASYKWLKIGLFGLVLKIIGCMKI